MHQQALDRMAKTERQEFNAVIDFYENQTLSIQALPPPETEPTRRLRMFTLALRQICFDRSRALFNAAMDAFAKDNPYAMTTLIRSHIESTVLLGYIFRQLRQASGDSATHPEIGDTLRDLLLGTRDPSLIKKGAPATLNILTMAKHADSTLKETLFAGQSEKPSVLCENYEFLCEFAHPNFYSHKLAVTFDSKTGFMHFRDNESMNEIEAKLIGYVSISGSIFRYLYDETLKSLPTENPST